MALPQAIAQAVEKQVRFLYLGITPDVGVYTSAHGFSNFEPFQMFEVKDAVSAQEPEGTIAFLQIQVSDGTEPKVDRNAHRLANHLGPPIGHPALPYNKTVQVEIEYILVRVLCTNGTYTVEGMIKGTDADTDTKVRYITKDTWVGVTCSGSGRDPYSGLNPDTRGRKAPVPKPAMSNAEIEAAKTMKARTSDVIGSSM